MNERFEVRFSDSNDIWGEWSEARDHQSVMEFIFGPRSKHIQSVRYQYNDGSCIEYRRIKEQ